MIRTKYQINYLRSFEYDQWVRGHSYIVELGRQQATVVFPRMDPFDPKPFAPVFDTMMMHKETIRDLFCFVWDEPEESKYPTPLPENFKDPALKG